MNLSGIVVLCQPRNLTLVSTALRELPGVEVHFEDQDQGKIVVVQEALSIAAEMNGLLRIKAVPGVILADMLYHYFEEDPEILDGLKHRQGRSTGESDLIPPSLAG
jgi:periplasmic nitrate reductase NapD